MLTESQTASYATGKIGIDAFSLARNDSGIEVYVRKLIEGLSTKNIPLELYTYRDIDIKSSASIDVRNSELKNYHSTLAKLSWELKGIDKLVSSNARVFHSPHFILPFSRKKLKRVVTVHDLAFLRCPEFFDWKTKLYYRLFLKRSLKNADAIICISESCRADLKHYFPFVAAKVKVIYHGYKDFSTIDPDNSILKDLGVTRPFVLMIGTLNPRKNLERSVQAFTRARETQNMDLVIAGSLTRSQLPFVEKHSNVKFTGFITDEKLSALYRSAAVLLYASHYEGFGFPILEAMSVGIPVVTANNSSLPEISGYPHDLLADANDVDSIAATIDKVLQPERREQLVRHGAENLKRFSWDKMITQTIEVYDAV